MGRPPGTYPGPAAAPAPDPHATGTPHEGNNRQARLGRNIFGRKKPAYTKKFEGRCEELKTHVYDMTSPKESATTFTTTTTEIAKHVGSKYKMGNYMKRLIKKLTFIGPSKPSRS